MGNFQELSLKDGEKFAADFTALLGVMVYFLPKQSRLKTPATFTILAHTTEECATLRPILNKYGFLTAGAGSKIIRSVHARGDLDVACRMICIPAPKLMEADSAGRLQAAFMEFYEAIGNKERIPLAERTNLLVDKVIGNRSGYQL